MDPEHLKKLIGSIPGCTLNLQLKDLEAVKTICSYCGICWEEGKIKAKSEDTNDMTKTEKMVALGIFQENLVHFFEHFDKFLQVATVGEFSSWVLTKAICADFEQRAIEVFKAMACNFHDQLVKPGRSVESHVADDSTGLIESLCAGDLERALKLVPSRELARQMGISDQRLRREIYLARQRALKKRPLSKSAKRRKQADVDADTDVDTVRADTENEIDYGAYFDMEIVTCASPPSSTTSFASSSGNKEFSDDREFGIDDDAMLIEPEDNIGVIDEWSIESLIRSDLFES